MRFPRYWTTAKTGQLVTWGWSDASSDDALRVARERQQRVIAFLNGKQEVHSDDYGYPDRPLREEVIREFPGSMGSEPAAIISRNSLGCLVLNTARLMFVDVDETPVRRKPGGFWTMLFGRSKPAAIEKQPDLLDRVEEQARQWVASNPAWKWRIYRTRAGVRLMAVHDGVAVNDAAVPGIFEAFGADPLYRRLCREQGSYRARLTPKPWRCGAGNRPARWPFRDAEAEAGFRCWDAAYLKTAIDFATCRFSSEVGAAPVSAEFSELIKVHDDATQAHHDLPLA